MKITGAYEYVYFVDVLKMNPCLFIYLKKKQNFKGIHQIELIGKNNNIHR